MELFIIFLIVLVVFAKNCQPSETLGKGMQLKRSFEKDEQM